MQQRRGFTLIELAIVLGIIALVIGGIVVGTNMARSAAIQGVRKDFTLYDSAVAAFRDRYNDWPGDMTNAFDIWKTVPGGAYTPTSAKPCGGAWQGLNGDGDGFVEQANWVNDDEALLAWRHLVLAQMVTSMRYPEGYGLPNWGMVAGVTTPESTISGAAYWFSSTVPPTGSCAGTSTAINGKHGNFLLLGMRGDGSTDAQKMLTRGAMTPAEAAAFDEKYDDLKSTTGMIFARDPESGSGTCISGTGYNVTSADTVCRIGFWLQ